jgi:1-acyl-sn-glycerol-3-phosphate acyltransferase
MLRPFKPVDIAFGPLIALTAHYGHRLDDPLVLREATDEIMWEIAQLSGQKYVDRYASRSAQAAEDAKLASVGSASTVGTALSSGASPAA